MREAGIDVKDLEQQYNIVEADIMAQGASSGKLADRDIVKSVEFSDNISLSSFKTQMAAVRTQFSNSVSSCAKYVQ